MPISTDDWATVNDHIGRYCWAVDQGRADDWADLWTPDGEFHGIEPEPVAGREALKGVPTKAFKDFGGKMFHLAGNVYCDYGDDKDTVVAHLYNYVTNWLGGKPQHFVMAICVMTLVRNGSGWLIKKNDAEIVPNMDLM